MPNIRLKVEIKIERSGVWVLHYTDFMVESGSLRGFTVFSAEASSWLTVSRTAWSGVLAVEVLNSSLGVRSGDLLFTKLPSIF